LKTKTYEKSLSTWAQVQGSSKPAPDVTKRKDQARVLKTKTYEKSLSTWAQVQGSSKPAPEVTKRKDQVRVRTLHN